MEKHSPSPEKEKLAEVLERIQDVYPKILDPDLDLISEVVAILGEESPEKKKQKMEEMAELDTALNHILEELVQNHFEDFNYMIASIYPFSESMEDISSAIRKVKGANEECKKVIQEQATDIYNTVCRDVYFNEMLEGVQRLENFYRLIQKVNYHLGNDNVLLATKGISKLTKKVLAEEGFLRQLNVFDYINTQVEDCKYKISTVIEENVMRFLFLAEESTLRQRVEKLYGLYKKDFEVTVEGRAMERDIASDFGVMVRSSLLERYLDFITGEYTSSRLRQIDTTMELITKYERERKTNLIVSGGMEKLMLNTSSHLNSQNISHLVLLLYCYSNLNSFAQLNEKVTKGLQDNLQRVVADTLRSTHLCGISNPISESTFAYLNTYKQKQYFDQLTCSLELSDMFKTYLTTSVLLSVCFSVGLELIFYDYLAEKMKKEQTTVSVEGINSLEYYIKTYSQVVLEFTELVQGLYKEERSGPEKPLAKKWTLRFSVRDVAGHESYLREGEHKNVEFINVVKGILIEDLIRPNNFQVPLFNNQFAMFHHSLKRSYDKTLKSRGYEDMLNNILLSFMQSNYDVFVEKVAKTLMSLHAKYLANTRTIFDMQVSQTVSMNAIFSLADPVIRSHKSEAVLVFELFCDIMKHVLGSCSDKRIFFSILGVLNQFIGQMYKSFKEAFDNEVADTHYMKQFDKNYYDFEKDSYAFRSIKYPFLYTPVGNLAESSGTSKLYSQADDKKRQEVEYALLHFKLIAPQTHWLGDTKKVTRLYILHMNVFYIFEAIDALFETLSHSPNAYLFGKHKEKPLIRSSRELDMTDTYVRTLKGEILELEDLFADSLIVLKADIMNQVLFYSKELGTGNYWRSEDRREKLSPSAVKLVRDIKLHFSVLSDLTEGDEKRLFYIFNYIPRLLSKALCLTSMNFENRRINRVGVLNMQEAIKYISDKLGPIAKFANKKLLVDYTFTSPEGRNDLEKAMLFYEIFLLEEGDMVTKLKQARSYFTAEEAILIMTTETHLRKPVPDDVQNKYKKIIFGAK